MPPVPSLPRVWIVTHPDHPRGLVAPIAQALEGCPPGLVGVQLRAKQASDRELLAWGRELRAITRAAGAPLTLNRRADLATIVGADGVHLPERGIAPAELRRHWPALKWIGVSRHDAPGLLRATDEGASFAFLSPVFEVPEKGAPLGVAGFIRAIAGVALPTYALGGLAAEHVRPLLSAGARGIALRRAIYDAEDPRDALSDLLRELDNVPPSGD